MRPIGSISVRGRFLDFGHSLAPCLNLCRLNTFGYRADLVTVDPDNVLLARQNALRISAEAVRDSGLAVSGLLFSKTGGPAVRPFQSERVTMEGGP